MGCGAGKPAKPEDATAKDASPDGDLEFEEAFPVAIDEFGAELLFVARIATPGAIEIIVEPDAMEVQSRTFWVDEDIDRTLTFSWGRND